MTHDNLAVLVDTQSLIRNMAIYKMILHNILNVFFFSVLCHCIAIMPAA